MRILVSNCESAKHEAICWTYACKQRDTHSWEHVRGCACTKLRACLREYVTTVTMMSFEEAKNACRVAKQGAKKATKTGESSKSGCLSTLQGGKKVTKTGESSKSGCLSTLQGGKKATKTGESSKSGCLSS